MLDSFKVKIEIRKANNETIRVNRVNIEMNTIKTLSHALLVNPMHWGGIRSADTFRNEDQNPNHFIYYEHLFTDTNSKVKSFLYEFLKKNDSNNYLV